MDIKANYHTHTVLCRHAVGSEREYIEQAIELGFTDLGFSDHVPYFFPDGYENPFKMRIDEAEGYFQNLLELRREYAEDIRLHIGFEAEYYRDIFKTTFDYLNSFPLDYLILGQHYVGGFKGWSSFDPTPECDILKAYVDEVCEAVGTGLFSAVAHPDVINFTGDEEFYNEQMKRLCRALNAADIPAEINMFGAASENKNRRHYPSERFFKIAAEEKCKVIIGCDAHSPKMLANEDGYRECMRILSLYGITPQRYLKFKKLK